MTNTKILLVDDEPDVREVVREILEDHVGEIFEAGNGEEALQFLATNTVDAVLSDVNMPKLNGIEFLQSMRNRGDLTPFVVLTAFGDKDMAIEALRYGAFEFLDKPWDRNQLKDTMLRAVELGQEFNFWKNQPDMMQGLEELRTQNSEKSLNHLKKVLSMMSGFKNSGTKG